LSCIFLTISRVPFYNPFAAFKFLSSMTIAPPFTVTVWVGRPFISKLLKNSVEHYGSSLFSSVIKVLTLGYSLLLSLFIYELYKLMSSTEVEGLRGRVR